MLFIQLINRKKATFPKYLYHRGGQKLPAEGKKGTNNVKGFSLMEIMIAMILVVGVISGLVYAFKPELSKGKMRQARITISQLSQALDSFYLDCNFYPSNAEGLEALVAAPQKCESWGPKPYLKKGKIPKDPWSNDFIYEYDEANGEYEVISRGRGGKEGGEGEAADISSKDL